MAFVCAFVRAFITLLWGIVGRLALVRTLFVPSLGEVILNIHLLSLVTPPNMLHQVAKDIEALAAVYTFVKLFPSVDPKVSVEMVTSGETLTTAFTLKPIVFKPARLVCMNLNMLLTLETIIFKLVRLIFMNLNMLLTLETIIFKPARLVFMNLNMLLKYADPTEKHATVFALVGPLIRGELSELWEINGIVATIKTLHSSSLGEAVNLLSF